LAIPTITAVPLNSVSARQAGCASGVPDPFGWLGGALAVAVFGALIAHHDTLVQGMQISLIIATALLLVTAAASLRLRDRGSLA
jgi:DHA2 family methylenomycin A resistance protein-like MFS transporter